MLDETEKVYPLRNSKNEAREETNEHVKILQKLAAGKDPFTGAELPNTSCYQSPKVIRTFFAAIYALEKKGARERALPQKAGNAWSVEEDNELIQSYDAGISVHELAGKHERSRGAIQSRLEKLGKMKPPYLPNNRFDKVDRPIL